MRYVAPWLSALIVSASWNAMGAPVSLTNDHIALYRVARIAPEGACVKVTLQPMGLKNLPETERTFCKPDNIESLRLSAEEKGFVGLDASAPENEFSCLPVTVAMSVERGIIGDKNEVMVWALPRPSPIYVRLENVALLALVKKAEEQKQGMVFAMQDSWHASDAAILSEEEALKLLGMTKKHP